MCGINGLSGNHEEAINQMNQALLHRGPDFAGRYVDDQISLGHTLLSIRSSESSSHQPFTKPHSPWILLFIDLTKEALAKGVITRDLIQAEVTAGHVRTDIFKLIA